MVDIFCRFINDVKALLFILKFKKNFEVSSYLLTHSVNAFDGVHYIGQVEKLFNVELDNTKNFTNSWYQFTFWVEMFNRCKKHPNVSKIFLKKVWILNVSLIKPKNFWACPNIEIEDIRDTQWVVEQNFECRDAFELWDIKHLIFENTQLVDVPNRIKVKIFKLVFRKLIN